MYKKSSNFEPRHSIELGVVVEDATIWNGEKVKINIPRLMYGLDSKNNTSPIEVSVNVDNVLNSCNSGSITNQSYFEATINADYISAMTTDLKKVKSVNWKSFTEMAKSPSPNIFGHVHPFMGHFHKIIDTSPNIVEGELTNVYHNDKKSKLKIGTEVICAILSDDYSDIRIIHIDDAIISKGG